VRLFVCVWPSDDARAKLEALKGSTDAPVRWFRPEHWHVTLAFLGEVTPERVDDLSRVLEDRTAALEPGSPALMGPATEVLGRHTLCVPVAGLDLAALTVREAIGSIVEVIDGGPFYGHLTLARAQGRRSVPRHLVGLPVEGSWPVRELSLVRSDLSSDGPRYQILAVFPLREPPA
jgi:2'-5' RNA ligase